MAFPAEAFRYLPWPIATVAAVLVLVAAPLAMMATSANVPLDLRYLAGLGTWLSCLVALVLVGACVVHYFFGRRRIVAMEKKDALLVRRGLVELLRSEGPGCPMSINQGSGGAISLLSPDEIARIDKLQGELDRAFR